MPDTGWQSPTAGASDSRYGTHAWANPGNIVAVDGSRAHVYNQTGQTYYLKATGYPADIPAAAGEGAIAQIAMPKSWDEGSLTFQIFWVAGSAGAGDVAWQVYATAQGDGDAAPVSWGLSALALTDGAGGLGITCITAPAAGPVAGVAEGDLLNVLVYRNAGGAADTYAGDAVLKGLRMLYTVAAKDDA